MKDHKARTRIERPDLFLKWKNQQETNRKARYHATKARLGRYPARLFAADGSRVCRMCSKKTPDSGFDAGKKICRVCLLSERSKYAALSPEKKAFKLMRDRQRYELNKKRYAVRKYARFLERIAGDPQARLSRRYRTTTAGAITAVKRGSRETLPELFGCDWPTLRAHVEAQFKPGMTWESHGLKTWHLDHIKPVTAFDLEDEAQRKEAFGYKNLQPLWARENHVKSNKWEEAA
jgi:hypothetical protein